MSEGARDVNLRRMAVDLAGDQDYTGACVKDARACIVYITTLDDGSYGAT